MALGDVVPSAILRKLASCPSQNELALALREVGRVERSLFLLRISLGRRGEIRDRSSEGQHHRMAGPNLLAGAIIHWNTRQLGRLTAELAAEGRPPDPALLPHLSPLGWEHINLTGESCWTTKR